MRNKTEKGEKTKLPPHVTDYLDYALAFFKPCFFWQKEKMGLCFHPSNMRKSTKCSRLPWTLFDLTNEIWLTFF